MVKNEIELNMWLLLKQADETEDMGKEEWNEQEEQEQEYFGDTRASIEYDMFELLKKADAQEEFFNEMEDRRQFEEQYEEEIDEEDNREVVDYLGGDFLDRFIKYIGNNNAEATYLMALHEANMAGKTIKHGQTRIGILLNPDYVLKVGKYKLSLEENKMESQIDPYFFPKTVLSDPNFRWIVVERIKEMEDNYKQEFFPELVSNNFPRIPEFLCALEDINDPEHNKARSVKPGKNLQKILDFMKRYNSRGIDFHQNNLGFVERDGKKELILIDGGFHIPLYGL